ncbi:MAG: hypothetical protein MUF15_17150 [Acidobacteria bacterium]|nr:hypothetical protein [Acidobacteriota bacterium]
MKRYALFVPVILFFLSIGCGKKDDIDYNRANKIWEQQIILIDNYITEVEASTKPETTQKAMDSFAHGLDELIPALNELFAKYPAFKERVKKENENKSALDSETQKKQDVMLKLIAAGLFTESLVKMKEGQLKAIAQLDEAQKRLLEVYKKLKLEDSLKIEPGVGDMYKRLVQGEIMGNSNPKVDKFFEKLRSSQKGTRVCRRNSDFLRNFGFCGFWRKGLSH